MRLVIQRVQSGAVSVEDNQIARIGPGLIILLGIGMDDGEDQASYLANKVAHLRIFEDENGRINQSLLDISGEAIVISQFTLYADTRKGRRPSFTNAASPDRARPLVDFFTQSLIDFGIPTQSGEFGAHMLVEINNDGPVTIILER